MYAVLSIHCITEQSSLAGHSWIEYCAADGPRTTFGTWGNDPVGKGNGLLQGVELHFTPSHSRTAAIDREQAAKLFVVGARYAALGDAGWTITAPCSAFAAQAWEAATGERLAHRLAGVSTPKTFAAAIATANRPQNPAHTKEQGNVSKPLSM